MKLSKIKKKAIEADKKFREEVNEKQNGSHAKMLEDHLGKKLLNPTTVNKNIVPISTI